MSDRSLSVGIASAIFVLVIWAGFIVFSRAGVLGGLTPYDLAATRFLVAGALTLPFAWAWWPRHLPFRAVTVLAIGGPGALYCVMLFLGLTQASAAYGGVFTNGALPVFTMLIAFLVAGTQPSRAQALGSVVIIIGGVLVAWRGLQAGGADLTLGIALFLGASVLVAIYIYGIRHWNVAPRQALVIVNIPSALIYLPIWWIFLPSTMGDAPMDMLLAQFAFQGLVPGFLAVIIFAVLAYHLGPTPTAAVSAAVPASAALLAIPVLQEVPTSMEWVGIGTVTLGLVLLTLKR